MALYSGGDIILESDAMGSLEGRRPGHSQIIMPQVEDRGAPVSEWKALLDIGTPGLWSLDGDE